MKGKHKLEQQLAAEPKASDYGRMTFPVLAATGYFDDDQPGALRYYRNHEAHAPAEALSRSYLVIGPWDHGGTQRPSKTITSSWASGPKTSRAKAVISAVDR